jgi:hypothetical protein
VQKTRKTDKQLRSKLTTAQQKLATTYAAYKLDSKKAQQIHSDILSLQKSLLDNYHEMQVELRKNVSKERFIFLRRRIDFMLKKQRNPQDGSSSTLPKRN